MGSRPRHSSRPVGRIPSIHSAASAASGRSVMSRRDVKAEGTDCEPPDIANDIRRLHKLSALLACVQHAVNYDVGQDLQVDVSDALAAVVLLINHEIKSLDELASQKVSP